MCVCGLTLTLSLLKTVPALWHTPLRLINTFPAGHCFSYTPLTIECRNIRPNLRRITETLPLSVLPVERKLTLPFRNKTALELPRQTLNRYPNNADPFVLPLFTNVRTERGWIPKPMPLSVPILGKDPPTLSTLNKHLLEDGAAESITQPHSAGYITRV